MSLGKELKIKNLKKQREFLKKMVKYLGEPSGRDGRSDCIYLGRIFQENKEYLFNEGICVRTYDSDRVMAATNGHIINVLYVSDKIELTEGEIKEAESIEIKDEEGSVFDCMPPRLREMLGSFGFNEE